MLVLGETAVSIEGSAAVLAAGLLSFTRDGWTHPRVEQVRWAHLPLVARPVGTVLFSGATDDLALIGVREGQVKLMHRDGEPLGSLWPGEVGLVAPDETTPSGLGVFHVTDQAIDELGVLVPGRSAASVKALGELLAQVRIALLPEPSLESLLDPGNGDDR